MRPFVTGPVQIWAGVGPGGTPLPLGYGVKAVEPQFRPEYARIMASVSGTMKPFARIYQGEDAMLNQPLSIWNESVIQTMRGAPGFGGPGFPHMGTDLPGDRGRIMEIENAYFQVWLVFPFASKLAMLGMPVGYHFYDGQVDGFVSSGNSTENSVAQITLYFGNVFVNTLINPEVMGRGGFVCYDNDMSAVVGKDFLGLLA